MHVHNHMVNMIKMTNVHYDGDVDLVRRHHNSPMAGLIYHWY